MLDGDCKDGRSKTADTPTTNAGIRTDDSGAFPLAASNAVQARAAAGAAEEVGETLAKIRVRRQASKHVYPHNDMQQAAHHFKTQIDVRFAAGDLRGISYDILAELIFLAFSVEAQVNFLGSKLVAGWKERDRFDDKFKKVLKRIGLAPNWNKRPFSTARVLKQLRDGLAHGKPIYREVDEVVVIDQDEADDPSFADLKGEWQAYCTPTFYAEAYQDVDDIWKQMLSKSGMRLFDTLTGGERSLQYIEHVKEDSGA